MRDEFGRRPRRRWHSRLHTVAMVGVVVAVLTLVATAQDPAGGDHEQWGDGWGVKRRLTVPHPITPQPPPAAAPQPAAAPEPAADAGHGADTVPRPVDAFPLTVGHVYDGDTIEATVIEPNDVVTSTAPVRIRLIGIDAPEGAPEPECWADEARTGLRELLPEGSTVWATPDADTWDPHGRRLFDLWTDDGRFVNLGLVAAGHAEVMRVWPNVGHHDRLAAAEAEAEASRAGLWGACG